MASSVMVGVSRLADSHPNRTIGPVLGWGAHRLALRLPAPLRPPFTRRGSQVKGCSAISEADAIGALEV